MTLEAHNKLSGKIWSIFSKSGIKKKIISTTNFSIVVSEDKNKRFQIEKNN